MRIICVEDDGDMQEIEVALRRNPYTVRGLLMEALYTNQEALADSVDFLRAEQAIRDALQSFSGDQEKYVRSYVLTRTLDQRTLETPRAGLIRFSFEHGGPLALIGVFYATLNAHRSPKIRDTLEYLCGAPDTSKLELFARAKSFPGSPHVATWLGRLFDRLDIDSQGLACLLRCLGSAGLPRSLFSLAHTPSRTWGLDGEVISIGPQGHAIILDEQRFELAIDKLQFVGFVKCADGKINLDSQIAELLETRLHTPLWKAEAVKLLCHVFPKHCTIDPKNYKSQCESLLPQLRHVCTHLDEPYVMSFCGRESQVGQVTEVFLSASHFGDHAWKTKCISLANQTLGNTIGKNSSETLILDARVRTRQALISYTYETEAYEEIAWPAIDHLSNAFSADVTLLKAENYIKFHAFSSAYEALKLFNPSLYGSNSTFELLQTEEINLCRARIALLEGKFAVANSILSQLPRTKEQVVLYLSVALCELGRGNEAEDLLGLLLPTASQSGQLQLAAANVRLFRCMHARKHNIYDWNYGQATRTMYLSLYQQHDLTTLVGKRNHFMNLSGLAILDQLDGRLDSAMARWEETLAFCKKYLVRGFTDMIVAYSIGELEIIRGNILESEYFTAKAKSLFRSTGRQYYFLGLGSIWPDILGQSYEARGYQRVVPEPNSEVD